MIGIGILNKFGIWNLSCILKKMFQLSRKVQRHAKQVRLHSQFWNSLIDVKPEVKEALDSNGPVVALESTIITHGMPYPQNLETALQVENIVRQEVSH